MGLRTSNYARKRNNARQRETMRRNNVKPCETLRNHARQCQTVKDRANQYKLSTLLWLGQGETSPAPCVPVFAKNTSGPTIFPQSIFPGENRSRQRRNARGIRTPGQKYETHTRKHCCWKRDIFKIMFSKFAKFSHR